MKSRNYFKCSRTEKCTECQAPYVPNEDGGCSLCKETEHYENNQCKTNRIGCLIQVESERCLQCSKNYYLVENKCIKKNDEKECEKNQLRDVIHVKMDIIYKTNYVLTVNIIV